MTEKESVISKVKKLYAKAGNNDSIKEVEALILKAQELMAKYNLSESEVEFETAPKKKDVIEEDITDRETSLWWVTQLGYVISKNFRCDIVEHSFRRKRVLRFVGYPDDVVLAKEVFNFARESLDYFSQLYVVNMCDAQNDIPMYLRPEDKKKFFTVKDYTNDKNDYIKGFMKGLDAKLKEQVNKNNWGLIVVKDKDVIEYTKKHYSGHKSIPSGNKGSGNREHYNAGYKDGYSMEYRNDLLKG